MFWCLSSTVDDIPYFHLQTLLRSEARGADGGGRWLTGSLSHSSLSSSSTSSVGETTISVVRWHSKVGNLNNKEGTKGTMR